MQSWTLIDIEFKDFLILTHYGLVMHMVAWIWVNIGSGNGLVPDGTKPLPEKVLTSH